MRGADIAVGGTTSGDIVSREDWLKPGCTFISLARRELDPAGWSKMDKVVIDSWEFNMLQREFKRMVESGLFSREQLHAEIHELVAGQKMGRERDDERILIHTTGLVSQDVALAHFLYELRWKRASACGCPRRTERIVNASRNSQPDRRTRMSSKSRMDRRGFLRNAGRAALGASAAGGARPLASPAAAQEKFPARDINWIIYQAPGGSIDTTARIIQPYLEKAGVKTTLEYVLGAGGRVARTKLFTARPDGYVMMTESAPGGAIDEVIGRASYKASEFIPIYGWSVMSWQICVKKDLPIRPSRIRRRVQEAPRRHRHHRPRRDRAISSSPRCRRN